jgi:hypothetical protein
MRNIFDQYQQPENRLTHALTCALDMEPTLLNNFVKWVTGNHPPTKSLAIVEQNLPGEEGTDDTDEAYRRGLPDAWIHDGEQWSVIIESKIESRLDADQLERHHRTASRRGFLDCHVVAFVTERPKWNRPDVTTLRWTDLYCWLLQQRSEWSRRVAQYMEVLEEKLVADGYLKSGTLTVFSGIPFGSDNRYNYYEAKRVLRLAMDKLRVRTDLRRRLGIDSVGTGRPAITGTDGGSVWDFVQLNSAKGAAQFTAYPHFTLAIDREQVLAPVIIPNAMKSEFRANLRALGAEHFEDVVFECLRRFRKTLGKVAGASPWMEVIQRRWSRGLRAEPVIDALLRFDPRTATDGQNEANVKQQREWLHTAYEVLANRRSNIQLAFGATFPFDRCPAVRSPEILDHIANAWLSCKPLLDAVMSNDKSSEFRTIMNAHVARG